MTILAYGDPHGVFSPLLSAARDLGPADTVIIVGDFDADCPISTILKPVKDRGTKCLWVPGNHDVDNSRWYDNTFEAMPTSNIHGTYRSAGGRTVGGLGGIFGETVWYPRFEMTPARHQSPADYMRGLKHQERWRKGLPLNRRAFIFPEAYEAVAGLTLDIIVTHEAPAAGHEHGFVALDELAKRTGARLMLHGHHHRSYTKQIGNLTIKGLAKAEVWVVPEL
jgi:Icc-related predicted phosphoesterase